MSKGGKVVFTVRGWRRRHDGDIPGGESDIVTRAKLEDVARLLAGDTEKRVVLGYARGM
jgi:hypothetical protein